MRSYKLSEAAKSDLNRIWLYGFKEYGLDQADKYYYELFNRFETIAENPYIYQAVDDIREGYRRCPYGTDSIYYRINDGCVEIMNIIGRQNAEDWL